ncbi:unnamed protein product [Boreogadus saida]
MGASVQQELTGNRKGIHALRSASTPHKPSDRRVLIADMGGRQSAEHGARAKGSSHLLLNPSAHPSLTHIPTAPSLPNSDPYCATPP